jgi:hypothetical protein
VYGVRFPGTAEVLRWALGASKRLPGERKRERRARRAQLRGLWAEKDSADSSNRLDSEGLITTHNIFFIPRIVTVSRYRSLDARMPWMTPSASAWLISPVGTRE